MALTEGTGPKSSLRRASEWTQAHRTAPPGLSQGSLDARARSQILAKIVARSQPVDGSREGGAIIPPWSNPGAPWGLVGAGEAGAEIACQFVLQFGHDSDRGGGRP